MTAASFYLIAKGIALLMLALGALFVGGGIRNFLQKAGQGIQRVTMAVRDAIDAFGKESIKAHKEFRRSRRQHTVIDNRELLDAISGFGVRTQFHYVEGWLEDDGDKIDFDAKVPAESFPLVVSIRESKDGNTLRVQAIFVTVLDDPEPEAEKEASAEEAKDETAHEA